ncbi:MAG TPA: hypothetical protein GXX58_11740 [Gelria sp.]|nr:hypothetical protein [Gelria sp.]
MQYLKVERAFKAEHLFYEIDNETKESTRQLWERCAEYLSYAKAFQMLEEREKKEREVKSDTA